LQRAINCGNFIAKLGIVEEEADECVFWIECIRDAGFIRESRLTELLKEANELTAIMVASIRTAKRNKGR